MNWYGEAVLLREFGKIPDDVRKVNVPLCIERRFGLIYSVRQVDAALLGGRYLEAYVLVDEDKKGRFKRITKNNEGYCSPSLEQEVIQEAVESELKGRYTREASGLREICEFFKRRNATRLVL